MVDEKEKNKKDLEVDTTDLKENEILQIKDDTLFHDLFNANDMALLEWITMEILSCSFEEVHGNVSVINERLVRARPNERNKIVDLLIKYHDEFILVELNNNYLGDPVKSLVYAFNLLTSCYDFDSTFFEETKDKKTKFVYDKPMRGILVNLNWNNPEATKRIRETPGKVITNWNYPTDSHPKYQGHCLKIYSINLDYYAKICYNEVTKGDRFFKLLTINNKKELMELASDNPKLRAYASKLEDLSCEEEYRNMLISKRLQRNLELQENEFNAYALGEEKGLQQGLEQGISQGISQGIEQKQREMVTSLNNQGVSLDVISKASNLSIHEIETIINNQ